MLIQPPCSSTKALSQQSRSSNDGCQVLTISRLDWEIDFHLLSIGPDQGAGQSSGQPAVPEVHALEQQHVFF